MNCTQLFLSNTNDLKAHSKSVDLEWMVIKEWLQKWSLTSKYNLGSYSEHSIRIMSTINHLWDNLVNVSFIYDEKD